MPNFTDTEMRAWRGFLHTHATVSRALDTDLATHGLNLPAYELLLALQEAGRGGVRMTDLARTLRFSGGRLTRLADRLELQGLIERRRCPDDGRGYDASLTRTGASTLKRVHAKHLRQVRARFLDRLSAAEVEALAAVWSKFPETAVPSTEARERAAGDTNVTAEARPVEHGDETAAGPIDADAKAADADATHQAASMERRT